MQDSSKNKGFWKQANAVSQNAVDRGALQTVETDYEIVPDQGIGFTVRIISRLSKKPAGLSENRPKARPGQPAKASLSRAKSREPGEAKNPFLPYEKDLYVRDISDTHVCLLNKYNVIPNHILLVTRDFQYQETVLNYSDFLALTSIISDGSCLGFYNSGEAAGASQPHKHLQVIPLPLSDSGVETPVSPWITKMLSLEDKRARIPQFDFKHRVINLAAGSKDLASDAYHKYTEILQELSLTKNDNLSAYPYNLIITSKWMIIVPRSREFVEGISINSLGYAGGLLVKNKKELDVLKKTGPLELLRRAAVG